MNVFTTILLVLALTSACTSTSVGDLSARGFWEDVFSYFEYNHFKIIHPDTVIHPDLPPDSLRLLASAICKQAVVDIHTSAAKLSLSTQQQRRMSSHLGLAKATSISLHRIAIHPDDLSTVGFPIVFQDFDALQKEDAYFAENDKCGLSIAGLWVAGNKAVVMYSTIYSPLSGGGYLLYLVYMEQTGTWLVAKRESIWMS